MAKPSLTITLRFIRDCHPCAASWTTLCRAMGDSASQLGHELTFGDIAHSNGAADALWCLDQLQPHPDVLRRIVVREILLPMLERNPSPGHMLPLPRIRQWANNAASKPPKIWIPSSRAELQGASPSRRTLYYESHDFAGSVAAYIHDCWLVSVFSLGEKILRIAGAGPGPGIAEAAAQARDIIRTFPPIYFKEKS